MKIRIKLAAIVMAAYPSFSAAENFAVLPQLETYKVPESWRQPVAPLKIAGNTWQIGTEGITSLLLKGKEGSILIDGGMEQTAEHLLENIRRLGVAPSDLKLILHSQAHADHIGSIAELKRVTGAQVVTNAESAVLMARGGANDIHFADELLYPPIKADRILHDGEQVVLGDLRLRVHFIPGHTPGSMAWTWEDNVEGKATDIAYVDSLTAPSYQLIDNRRYPNIVEDFRTSFARVRDLPCDLLVTPHVPASGWEFKNTAIQKKSVSCLQYAQKAEEKLNEQLESERDSTD
ncbi:subclass B3 metallo-beta-lactamase [Microbulbifer sp. VAAF005]|uniref:subclass B3 metallo-beta-lactamase n=1 Tax=Microbulbifer sp. VAAF005 TaxID=3034230 RepID=UPI0024ADE1F6|nr:subclass B3 metallo-beta-lactamase [Microbulbifer sp. VAAF005]WHI44634.1 subclass B3 metallo-beta-lactamase [Microbulbifer sp. VAAF005]